MSPAADTATRPAREEFLERFRRRCVERRVPVSGSAEITFRCNLRCLHCFLKGERTRPAGEAGELDTAQWLRIIDEVAAAGCLDLLISGGEPLLRPDFAALYRHAAEKGIGVTLFTNGTLVDDAILALFADLPPQAVEVTLYGATAATYEAVTRVPGSHARCLRGIRSLRERGLPLMLKTMVLRENVHELPAIEALAKEFGVRFRLDPALFPCADGDRRPLESRIPAAQAVALEFADPDRARRWRDYYLRLRDLPGDERLFSCGAALTGFHVDPRGRLSPCSMLPEPHFDLAGGSFHDGWGGVLAEVAGMRADAGNPCGTCGKRVVCGLCPGFSFAEGGSLQRPAPYLCELGEHRLRAIEHRIETARPATLG